MFNVICALYLAYWLAVLAVSARRRNTGVIYAQLRAHLLVVGGIIMVIPFFWMISTSLKSGGESMAYPPVWWPATPQWKNYIEAWNAPETGFGRYYAVSIISSVIVTAGTLFTSILAAYAFAQMQFRGKQALFLVVLATLMVPGEVLLIPNYIMIVRLNWPDTYQALTVPWLASVFSIFLIRQFFMGLPPDLWDAAQIDGAGRWRYLWRVAVPLSSPVLITAGIFTFIGTWNALLWPLVVTNHPEMRTLMVGLQVFTTEAGGDINLLMAASTFCIIPVVCAFFFFQRYFIEGISRSGLK